MARKRNYRPQERYRDKQVNDRGFVRLSIWVPPEARDEVMKLADKLRRLARTQPESEGSPDA